MSRQTCASRIGGGLWARCWRRLQTLQAVNVDAGFFSQRLIHKRLENALRQSMQVWCREFRESCPAVHAVEIQPLCQVIEQKCFQRIGVVKQILEKSFTLGAHHGVGVLALG